MTEKTAKGYLVKLEGHVVSLKGEDSVSHPEFITKFTRWLESEGMGYTGFSVQVDEDGNTIEDIEG
ncbi:hypothetical protein [Pseudalkalibacillus sp. SCS-8]|uniref:hypothetical protein n=1 Tax=Pseudalkalibacillus nanhaiensis TaxID=3115291 RepID=UPI0032DB1E81